MCKVEQVIDKITHGIYVIGVNDGAKKNLMTAAWMMQISSRPAEIIAAVSKNHLTAELLSRAKVFSVSVLAKGQEEVARACGLASGRDTDKTAIAQAGVVNGIPCIKDCAAVFICSLKDEIPYGNHTLFIGEVVEGKAVSDKETLLYDRSLYFG